MTTTLDATATPNVLTRERQVCGWCNSFVAGDPQGSVRHVTCGDCRSLASTSLAFLVRNT